MINEQGPSVHPQTVYYYLKGFTEHKLTWLFGIATDLVQVIKPKCQQVHGNLTDVSFDFRLLKAPDIHMISDAVPAANAKVKKRPRIFSFYLSHLQWRLTLPHVAFHSVFVPL
jgi:hypothetical protein